MKTELNHKLGISITMAAINAYNLHGVIVLLNYRVHMDFELFVSSYGSSEAHFNCFVGPDFPNSKSKRKRKDFIFLIFFSSVFCC